MPKPLLIAVDDEPHPLSSLERELRKRYGEGYEVMCFPAAAPAVRTLEDSRKAGLSVAVVLADHWMPDMTGIQLLVRAHELHPQAKRVLLFAWGDRTSQGPILEASALGLMDAYAPKPSQSPDEQFHRTITELLEEWSRIQGPRFIAVRIVGDQWGPRPMSSGTC